MLGPVSKYHKQELLILVPKIKVDDEHDKMIQTGQIKKLILLTRKRS